MLHIFLESSGPGEYFMFFDTRLIIRIHIVRIVILTHRPGYIHEYSFDIEVLFIIARLLQGLFINAVAFQNESQSSLNHNFAPTGRT